MVVRTLEWKPEYGDVVRIFDIGAPLKKPWWVEDCSSGNRAKRVVVGIYRGLVKVNKLLYQFCFFVIKWKTTEEEIISEVPAYKVQEETTRPLNGSTTP